MAVVRNELKKEVNAIQGTMTLSIAEAEWHIRRFWPVTYLRRLVASIVFFFFLQHSLLLTL